MTILQESQVSFERMSMCKFRIPAFFFACLLCALNTYAGTEDIRLDREKTREIALDYSKQLKISKARLDQAFLREDIARAAQMPGLSAAGLYFYSPDELGFMLDPLFLIGMESGLPDIIHEVVPDIDLSVGLEGVTMAGIEMDQVIYAGGRVRIARQMASTGTSLASLDIELNTTEVIALADAAYYQYVSTLEKEKAAEKYLDLLEELVETVSDSKEAGMVTRNDLLKVKVERNEATLALQMARSGKELARMDLCRILGLPLHTPLETTAVEEISREDIMPLEQYDQRIAKRPEYQMLEKAIELSEQRERKVRAAMFPEVGLRAGYNYLGGIEIGGKTSENTSLSAMALVRIPIFNWGEKRHALDMARIDKEVAQLEKADAAKLLQLEMASERFMLEDALTRLELTRQALEQAEENLETSQDKFNEGKETLTDLLEAQAQWQSAYSNQIEARASVNVRETMYLKAIGELTVP